MDSSLTGRIQALTIILHNLQPQLSDSFNSDKNNKYLAMYRHIVTLLTTGCEEQGRGKRRIVVTGSDINPRNETELTVIEHGMKSLESTVRISPVYANLVRAFGDNRLDLVY